MNKICAVIPVCNEEKHLGAVLGKINKHGVDPIVVDDGSMDKTASVAEEGKACILRHAANEGKGRALRTGFRSALEKEYDFIITLDGDGQHDPDEMPSLIYAIREKKKRDHSGQPVTRSRGHAAQKAAHEQTFF